MAKQWSWGDKRTWEEKLSLENKIKVDTKPIEHSVMFFCMLIHMHIQVGVFSSL